MLLWNFLKIFRGSYKWDIFLSISKKKVDRHGKKEMKDNQHKEEVLLWVPLLNIGIEILGVCGFLHSEFVVAHTTCDYCSS